MKSVRSVRAQKVATKFSRSLGSNYFFRVVVLEGLLDGGRNRRRTSWKVGEARDVGSLTCERGGLEKKNFSWFRRKR